MAKHGKHRRFFQILVVPDDQAEPKAYSIPVSRLKFYKVLAILVSVHILLGLFAYYEFFNLLVKNRELAQLNRQLETNNNRIFELSSELEGLLSSQAKMRAALGLDVKDLEAMEAVDTDILPGYATTGHMNVSPVRSENALDSEDGVKAKIGFLTRSKSIIHNIEKSIPTYLPVEGILSKDYSGPSFELSKEGGHFGIDIAAESGSPVKAAADGIVLFSGWTQDLGNLIILYHGNGFYTYYGHNNQLLYQRNSFVKKGDPIATLGNSGHSSAPHLHFEIWRDGVPLDPKKYILAFSE